MAKTLIGNVKGKDGRGISKIEKTATTGVVDTYTITYTDGTQSTYELKNSDDIAIQRQIVPSAAVESSATASQAYTAGDYVVVGGILRKVTASITKGSTINDSNSTATTVTGELASVRDSYLHFELVALDKGSTGDEGKKLGEVTAPAVSGYSFISWVSTSTVGWVGACYFENPMQKTSGVWCAAESSATTGYTQCYALYTKTV